jgi:hypothetical protein
MSALNGYSIDPESMRAEKDRRTDEALARVAAEIAELQSMIARVDEDMAAAALYRRELRLALDELERESAGLRAAREKRAYRRGAAVGV